MSIFEKSVLMSFESLDQFLSNKIPVSMWWRFDYKMKQHTVSVSLTPDHCKAVDKFLCEHQTVHNPLRFSDVHYFQESLNAYFAFNSESSKIIFQTNAALVFTGSTDLLPLINSFCKKNQSVVDKPSTFIQIPYAQIPEINQQHFELFPPNIPTGRTDIMRRVFRYWNIDVKYSHNLTWVLSEANINKLKAETLYNEYVHFSENTIKILNPEQLYIAIWNTLYRKKYQDHFSNYLYGMPSSLREMIVDYSLN